MSLQDIRHFLDELEDEGTGPAAMSRVRGMFERKLHEVRSQLEHLESLASELADGLAYLATCTTCSPTTELGACRSCHHDHPIEPPLLITGIHEGGEGSPS